MANNPLNEDLQAAIRLYVEGSSTLDDLRRAAIAHLHGDDVEWFFRAIPADAAANMVRWIEVAREDTRDFVQVGNFESAPPPISPVRTAMITYVRRAADWLSTLNVAAATSNVRIDSYGDWYRDPWGWPELAFLAGEGRAHVLARALTGPVGAAIAIDVPKSSTKTRPAVVLEIVDRVLYQACVDSIAPTVDQRLKDWVFGWRSSGKARYANNQKEWLKYFRRLRTGAARYGCGWHTDISDFFASVPRPSINEALHDVAPPPTAHTITAEVQTAMDSVGRHGIPQRSSASSVLANLLLGPVDEVVDEVAEGAMPARWLDDVWIFAENDQDILRAAETITAKIVDLGYNVNKEKTSFWEGDTLTQAIDRLNFSYIDSQLENTAQTPVLARALEFLIASHETAARHEIGFVTSRIKRYHRVDLALQLAEHRNLFLHAADLIAPVLLKCGVWRDLVGWSGELLASDQLPWIKTSFLRMYPRAESWPRRLSACFAEASVSPRQDALVRITALSRLPRIAPKLGKEIFDAHERSSLDPMLRRALAVVGLCVGVAPKRLYRFLLEDDRTVPFAEFMSSVNYQRSAIRVRA
jgi:hypothetical protein